MVEERERVLGEWEEETLVKVLRVLRAVVHMDDGVVDAAAWREGWRRTLGHERLERSVHEKETWVQDKYNALGFTQLAVHFMAAGTPAVAMEAMYLLAVLMQEGNRGVQDAAHDLLAGDMELGGRWFGYLASTFDAYIAHHQEADPLQAAGGGSGRSRSSRDSGSQSRGSRRNGGGSARSMPHREMTEVASRMPSMSVDDDEVGGPLSHLSPPPSKPPLQPSPDNVGCHYGPLVPMPTPMQQAASFLGLADESWLAGRPVSACLA